MAHERTVLVVEGNTPELIQRSSRIGAPPPGLNFGTVLRALDPSIEIQIVGPSFPDFDPTEVDLDGVVGAALTGSGVSWSADAREAAPHRIFLDRLFAAEIPVFGSCWGLQVAVAVLGGSVRESAAGSEFGVARNVILTEAGRRHPMFAGKATAFDSVCMHRDEVDRTPQGAQILAGNAHSTVQAMVYEQGGVQFWGVQYHPELGLEAVAHALRMSDSSVNIDQRLFADRDDLDVVVEHFERMADDPDGETALRWRYGITDGVAHFDHRAIELANWVATLGTGEG